MTSNPRDDDASNGRGVRIGSVGEVNGDIIGTINVRRSTPAGSSNAQAHTQLRRLFVSMFAPWELRAFLRYDPVFQAVEPFLPGEAASLFEVAGELVTLLVRKGLVDSYLFSRLHANAPNRRDDIEAVARLFPETVQLRPLTDPGPHSSGLSFPPCDVLLVTVTSIEVRSVLDYAQSMTGHEERSFFGRHTYHHLGMIGGANTYVVRSEMGVGTPGGALLTVRNAIDALKPRAVVMVGIAFGTRPEYQSIGDVLIARQIHYYAPDRVGTHEDGTPRIIPRGSRADASGWLLDRLRTAELSYREHRTHFGLVLSGESLVDNLAFRDQLLVREPEAIGGEMEGAGLYAAAWDTETPWVLVKGICDWGDGHKHRSEKADSQRIAAESACKFVFSAIAQGGFKRPG